MKTTKRIFALVLVLLFVVSLAACGEKKTESKDDNSGNAAASAPAATAAPTVAVTEAPAATEDPSVGQYKLLGTTYENLYGFVVEIPEYTMEFDINADGTAAIVTTMDGESQTLKGKWTVSGQTLTYTDENGESMDCAILNGVIEVPYESSDGVDLTYVLAKEGADTSAYSVISVEAAKGLLGQS